MINENFEDKKSEDKKSDWPGALIGIAFLAFLLLVCFGNRLLDWLGAPS